MDAEEAVAEANSAFYAAFETLDLEAMAQIWERSRRAVVTHPGWATLHGWERVAESWRAIFSGTTYIQFIITDAQVFVEGDVAWVVLVENILSGLAQPGPTQGALGGARVAALNVFVRREGRWLMVAHHGSPVARG